MHSFSLQRIKIMDNPLPFQDNLLILNPVFMGHRCGLQGPGYGVRIPFK